MRANRKKRYWLWILGGLLAAFALWNAVWFFGYYLRYQHYIKEDYRSAGWNSAFVVRTGNDENWFTCSVGTPEYLRFSGNLSVVSRYHTYFMDIWPEHPDGEGRYAVGVGYPSGLDAEDPSAHATGYTFCIRADLTPEDDAGLSLVEQYRDEIEELFAVAREEWDIDASA